MGTEKYTAEQLELLAEAEAAEREAEAALSPEEETTIALRERLDAARAKKRETDAARRASELSKQVDAAKARANGAYVVAGVDVDEVAEGAGIYVLRSPTKEVWKTFKEAVAKAGEDQNKVDVAYHNLAASCIVWPAIGDEFHALAKKYVNLTMTLGDAAGRLGGVGARTQKR